MIPKFVAESFFIRGSKYNHFNNKILELYLSLNLINLNYTALMVWTMQITPSDPAGRNLTPHSKL